MARYPDPHRELGRALTQLGAATIVESRQTAWASATFTGARHHFVLALDPKDEWWRYAAFEEREFDVPGHIVADIAFVAHERNPTECRLTIEALTVEDA